MSNRLQPAERAVYHLRRDFEQAPLGVPAAFAGEIADFVTVRAASGLETRGASYLTEYLLGRRPDEPGPDKARPTSSRLGLVFATESALEVERLEIAYPAHIETAFPRGTRRQVSRAGCANDSPEGRPFREGSVVGLAVRD